MRRRKRIEQMEGRGSLSHKNQNFSVYYRIDVDQDFLTTRTFGGSQTVGSLKNLSGWVEVQGDDLVDTFDRQDAVLQLSDGKKISILLEANSEPERELSFILLNAMDLRK